jgi:glycerol-3-phosphate dehydrogenase
MNDPAHDHPHKLASIAANEYDVLVIGGGIVGAGVARDAALRGLRTLLVERADFASGTSSRSSRLLHGGLRYLAQGRLGLVHEASQEKMRLSKLAPHLCDPLPFLFPVWKGDQWSRPLLSIGVRVYDLLCGRRNLGSSSSLSAAGFAAYVRGIRADGLQGGVRYFDALTNDARLVIDTLASAEQAGAALLNYTAFVSGARSGGAWTCKLRGELDGGSTEVRAKAVVNAAGAWAATLPHSGVRLRLTKGVHLVIDASRIPVREAVVLSEGKRILFVIPWGERLILGTTDTDYSGDPAQVRADIADIAYILKVVNRAFPGAAIAPGDLIATWAGVRPLIAPATQRAGAPSDISRNHQIRMTEPGWFDVAGGKLTTYRLMAEQTVDRIGRHAGAQLPRSRTADTPLARGPYSGILPPPIQREVVEHCCRNEWAAHLDDVLLRRTSWHYYQPDHLETAQRVAGWMSEIQGWSPDRARAEIERYTDAVQPDLDLVSL